MNYEEALQYIHSPRYNKMVLGLDSIKALLDALGNPQKKLKYIHIAGTNGKGSVASYLSHILRKANLKTGLFTSPYIERFNERIKVNGQDIVDEDLASITKLVKEKIEVNNIPITEFEIMTAIAFQYFYEQECDIVVLEVGLGGRLDSTNVIEAPLLSIITSISFDHQALLGTTLSEIAGEKAGIIKNNRPVLVYSQEKETEDAITQIAKDRNSPVFKPDFSKIKVVQTSLKGQTFHYKTYQNLKIKLLGDHQLNNAAMAIEAVRILNDQGMNINEQALRQGLLETTWLGRFEVIHEQPYVVIDGAHNIDSVRVLIDNLTKYFPNRKVLSILGMLQDKDVDPIIDTVLPLVSKFFTVTPVNPRAIDAVELAEVIRMKNGSVEASQNYVEALDLAFEAAETEDVICIFGSLYYIGQIRQLIHSKKYKSRK